jgi:hypothetical protein
MKPSRALVLVLVLVPVLALGGAVRALYHHDAPPVASAVSPKSGDDGVQTAKPSRFDRTRAPGLRHTYATTFDQDLSLTSGDGRGAAANANVKLRVEGSLDLAFVGHASGKHRLFARLADPRVAIGGARSAQTAAVERELAKPFFVLADTDGRVRGYSFARDVSPTTQNILRGVLGSAQIAVRDEAHWTADEDDIQGSYVASYAHDDAGAIVKTKRPYTKLEGMSSLDVRARGMAVVAEDGWATSLTFEEHKVASMGEKMPVATTDVRLEMKLTGTTPDGSLLGLFEREREQLVDGGPFGTIDDAEAAKISDRRMVGDASTDAILADAPRRRTIARSSPRGTRWRRDFDSRPAKRIASQRSRRRFPRARRMSP